MGGRGSALMELRWSRRAREDIDAIIGFYGDIEPDLPPRLVDAILYAPLALIEFPFLGPETEIAGIRKWRVENAPFLLFYVVSSDAVSIVRVRHVREGWQSAKGITV